MDVALWGGGTIQPVPGLELLLLFYQASREPGEAVLEGEERIFSLPLEDI